MHPNAGRLPPTLLQPSDLGKLVVDAADALKDAASAVRTLAQAAVRDIEDDLGRSKEALQTFVTDTLLSPATPAGDFYKVRGQHQRALD